jgi:hypothetical protein
MYGCGGSRGSSRIYDPYLENLDRLSQEPHFHANLKIASASQPNFRREAQLGLSNLSPHNPTNKAPITQSFMSLLSSGLWDLVICSASLIRA